MKNLDIFTEKYSMALYDSVRDHREMYAYGLDSIPEVVSRMRKAFEKGSFNKDSLAIKRVCKELKIKHSYEAINAFLVEEVA